MAYKSTPPHKDSTNNKPSDYSKDNTDNNSDNDKKKNPDSNSPAEKKIPQEIAHCSWSKDGVNGFPYTHPHIGPYGLCQEKKDERKVHLQIKGTISDSQVCLIPTYHSNKRAIYVGEPRCLLIDDNKKIYPITLLKNRAGYSNFKITGVMLMKDKRFLYPGPFYQYLLSPDAFLFCSQWRDQTGDNSYCDSFDSVAQYIDHQF